MSLTTYDIRCSGCSRKLLKSSYECTHCIYDFCRKCLIDHQHTTVREELVLFIVQIDQILAGFLHHAHSQTEWTSHLTEDRERLMNYIRLIDSTPDYLPIIGLPQWNWLGHVEDLICKEPDAINELCIYMDRPSPSPSPCKKLKEKN